MIAESGHHHRDGPCDSEWAAAPNGFGANFPLAKLGKSLFESKLKKHIINICIMVIMHNKFWIDSSRNSVRLKRLKMTCQCIAFLLPSWWQHTSCSGRWQYFYYFDYSSSAELKQCLTSHTMPISCGTQGVSQHQCISRRSNQHTRIRT